MLTSDPVWNIQPELWPAGDPEMHFAVGPYGDVDNTPYKAYLMEHRSEPEIKPFFELLAVIRSCLSL